MEFIVFFMDCCHAILGFLIIGFLVLVLSSFIM